MVDLKMYLPREAMKQNGYHNEVHANESAGFSASCRQKKRATVQVPASWLCNQFMPFMTAHYGDDEITSDRMFAFNVDVADYMMGIDVRWHTLLGRKE